VTPGWVPAFFLLPDDREQCERPDRCAFFRQRSPRNDAPGVEHGMYVSTPACWFPSARTVEYQQGRGSRLATSWVRQM